MIKVGALDCIGKRCTLLAGIDRIFAISESHFRAHECGQMSIFGMVEGLVEEIILPESDELDKKVLLDWEKELLGLYLTDHPLSDYHMYIKGRITHYSGQITEAEDKSEVVVAGTIADLRTTITRRGEEMGFAKLEDVQGEIPLTLFPRTWKEFRHHFHNDGVLVVKGIYETGRGEPQILVNVVEKIDLAMLQSIQGQFGEDGKAEQILDEDPAFIFDDDYFEDFSDQISQVDKPNKGNDTGFMDRSTVSEKSEQMPAAPSLLTEKKVQQGNRLVEVTLLSTGSKQRDKWRLRQVYNVLIATPGNDHFSFVCKENGDACRFDFPNDSTEANDAMLQQIKGMVGEANVKII